MSPNLYDLLDVEESATREEIRTAWRSATADLDPTDRRFRAYNEAASVLLDDEARAAYDAELAAAREDEATEEEATGDAPDADVVAPVEEMPAPADAAPVDAEPADPAPVSAPADAEPADAEPADAVPAASATGPSWRTVVPVVVLAVLSLALLITVWAMPGGHSDPSPHERQDSAEDAADTAVDAAAAMVPEVLGYDYRTFDEDEQQASSYLTDDFAAERTKLLTGLKKDVEKGKVVVSAAATGTALTRVSDDGDKAQVVVFIDQESKQGNGTPQPLRMWATFTLVRGEDDGWLLDDICTEDDC
jgi:Mce-associated membrane protein